MADTVVATLSASGVGGVLHHHNLALNLWLQGLNFNMEQIITGNRD